MVDAPWPPPHLVDKEPDPVVVTYRGPSMLRHPGPAPKALFEAYEFAPGQAVSVGGILCDAAGRPVAPHRLDQGVLWDTRDIDHFSFLAARSPELWEVQGMTSVDGKLVPTKKAKKGKADEE